MATQTDALRHGLGQPWANEQQKLMLDRSRYTGELSKALPSNCDDLGQVLTRRMRLLFEHHHVTFGDYHGLAMALAVTHVPAFRYSRRGRKPSSKLTAKRFKHWLDAQPNALLALHSVPGSPFEKAYSLARQSRRSGRPRIHTDRKDRQLLAEADGWIEKQRMAGRKRLSVRAFVQDQIDEIFSQNPEWLRECARQYGTTTVEAKKRLVNYWTVRVSRARKSVSKS